MNENWWEALTGAPADYFSGHRKITFEPDAQDDAPFTFGGEVDLMLLADNRIVASTASGGRYATGQAFFAREPQRYAELYALCCEDAVPCALLHVRGVALVSGAWLAHSGVILTVLFHGNTKRTLRVLSHCFGDDVRRIGAFGEVGGLRRDDEPFYRTFGAVCRQLRILTRGAGRTLKIETHDAISSLLRERITSIWEMLGLQAPTLAANDIPFPCVGEVNVTRTGAILCCLGLWLCRRVAAESGCGLATVRQDPLRLCPCLYFPLTARECSAMAAGERPIELQTAALLAEFDETVFACEVQAATRQLLVRFSSLRPSRADLYALRSHPPRLGRN